MRRIDRRHLITYTAFLLLSIGLLIELSKLPFGSVETPQAGFFPSILAVLLGILSLSQFVNVLRKKKGEGAPFRSGTWKRIGIVIGILFAYALSLHTLGYVVSTFLLLAVLLKAIEPQRWWLVVLVSFLGATLTYVMFSVLLSTPLPQGLLRSIGM